MPRGWTQAQYEGLGFPLWPMYFTLMISLFLGTGALRVRMRPRVVDRMGLAPTDRVLVLAAYRGLFVETGAWAFANPCLCLWRELPCARPT